MNGKRIRVVVVDDHELFRDGLAAILALAGDIDVVGSAANAHDAMEVVERETPDVVLLDVEMPGAHVGTSLARLLRVESSPKVVILTMHQDRILSRTLIQAGASAYMSKSARSAELLDAIRQAHFRTTPRDTAPQKAHDLLTPREVEVVRLISQAKSNAQIAVLLSISVGTVKRHTNNLYKKLEVASRIDALRAAKRLGLISAGH